MMLGGEYDAFCGRRMYNTVVFLSGFERDALKELCHEEQTSMANILRKALKDYYLRYANSENEESGDY